jgi:hypothetical protein
MPHPIQDVQDLLDDLGILKARDDLDFTVALLYLDSERA